MEHQEGGADLAAVPLSDRVGPQGLPIPPAAKFQRRRHIGDRCEVDSKSPQQTGRIPTDRYPGADLSKLGVLLEDLNRHRLLQEARRECEAGYAPANDCNVASPSHERHSLT